MTASRFKTLFYGLAFAGLLLISLSPLYMYFSYDVELLITKYPEVTRTKESITYRVTDRRPSGWVNLTQISTYAKWAIILSEDWAFYQHEGIDVEQIKVALNQMVEEKRFRGASTITQQMVKNVYLTEERTISRKLHEVILAYKVEKFLSKKRILEIYLNIIEFGPGIYGIKNASHHYFRKHPRDLDPKESAFLAMLLPSPKRYYISYRKKKLTQFARERVNAILVKMRMGKVLTPSEYEIQRSSKLSWESN